jgi:hypothetical protein
MEGSLVAYKVFTNGSVLQASELNENLMQQSIAVFSNAAARTSAITSPVEGQLTYLEDVNRYESYNGTSWGSPFGLTHISTTTASAVASVVVNNAFSSAYDNYLIVARIVTSPNPTMLRFRLSSGGTPVSGANYNYAGTQTTTGSGPNRIGAASATFSNFGTMSTESGMVNAYIASPFLASKTAATFQSSGASAAELWSETGSMGHNLATSYDGFELAVTSNTLTGTIRVYGVRN